MGDFGLARDIYTEDYYVSSREARVPVKWMSPEALLDGINNEKTDVVSKTYYLCSPYYADIINLVSHPIYIEHIKEVCVLIKHDTIYDAIHNKGLLGEV